MIITNTLGRFRELKKSLRGEKETKFANHERFNSFSANLPLFLGKDQGFCTQDSPSSLPWTGVGWGCLLHRSPQCGNHAGVVSWSLLPSRGNQKWAGSPAALPREGPLRFLEGKGSRGAGRSVLVLLFSEGRRTSRPLSTPSLNGFNGRAFLRKCSSWQQLQPIGAELWPPAP